MVNKYIQLSGNLGAVSAIRQFTQIEGKRSGPAQPTHAPPAVSCTALGVQESLLAKKSLGCRLALPLMCTMHLSFFSHLVILRAALSHFDSKGFTWHSCFRIPQLRRSPK